MEKRKLVLDIGINDADYSISKEEIIDGKRKVTWRCPYYVRWYNLLSRCYSKAALKKRPQYMECFVCEEWLTFSNFKRWMESQDWENKQLDKDLKVLGNKEYSPDNCLFISPSLNAFLNENENNRGECPIGVFRKRDKFAAQEGKKHLGYFESEESAHREWILKKIKSIDDWIVKEPKHSIFLMNYKNTLQHFYDEGKIYQGRNYLGT
jgi:hypothetical protein